MNTDDRVFSPTRRGRLGRVVFGDRIGLAVFLGTVGLFTLFWVGTWRITDSLTLLNALNALAEGRLHFGPLAYGNMEWTPGAIRVDGRFYGRNYGVLVAALVPMAALRALFAVADPRIAAVALWSLVVLAFALVAGRVVGRRRLAGRAGAGLALVLFAGNVALATPLDGTRVELYALQVVHLVAAALAVVFVYRLLARRHDTPVGLAGAALVALGTPMGLWATIPKRHVLTALVVLGVGYALYRAREATALRAKRRFRAIAYAAVGLFAWVHAPEALLLLVILAAVDLPTARATDARSLAAIAAAFLLSLIPFFVTNALLTGSPITPPRLFSPGGVPSGGETASGVSANAGSGGSAGGGLLSDVPLLSSLLEPLSVLLEVFLGSIRTAITRPGELWTVFVRSGYVESIASESDQESINLAVLESAPILALALGGISAGVRRIRTRGVPMPTPAAPSIRDRPLVALAPERVLDLYLGTATLGFCLLYLSKLPLHAQVTVRYLLPMFPALVVLAFGLPSLRRLVRTRWRLLVWSYAAAVLIGGQLLVVALVFARPGVGEAFQFHALVGLTTAALLGGWSLTGRTDGWYGRVGAVSVALATAATTLFLLLVSLEYFTVGDSQLLPLVRALGELLAIV